MIKFGYDPVNFKAKISTLKNWFMPTVTFIELWMHAGSLERSVSAESNSNFLNALQTSRVHP